MEGGRTIMSHEPIPAIVKQALTSSITDIGQLTSEQKRTLNRYVRRGWLSKGKGGGWPVLKTVYACPGFNFVEQRRDLLRDLL